MQDSLKSNSIIKKALALSLALLIAILVPLQTVSAITIADVAKIVEFGRLVYEVARLGWDSFQLYKDIESETDFYTKEEALINGMGRSDVIGSINVTGFSASSSAASSGSWPASSLIFFRLNLAKNNYYNAFSLLKSIGINRNALIIACSSTSLYGFMWNSEGKLLSCQFVNPFGSANVSYLGVYDSSSLTLSDYAYVNFNSNNYVGPLYYSKDYALSDPSFISSDCYVVDWDRTLANVSSLSSSGKIYIYIKGSTNPTFSSDSSSMSFGNTIVDDKTAGGKVCSSFWGSLITTSNSGITWDNSRIVVAAPEAEPETRPSSLMQAIHNYNVDNSYTDNSTTVNYLLAPKDQTPTSDNVVSPAIFDEETWVFTEPATGAQYQSTGWTYDYNTRTYDIDLEAGTFTLDGTDVTRIVSQYGNELATITYYDASGNALATDEYNYVMMAASECALNGHTYNANTTKEPNCTAAGERTYTCSACGDQYVEEIAKTDHVYADHTITQEPTCTVGGISSKTCSTCGDQIIEKLDSLGHDFIAKEITETTYELPPGTSCPSCSGTIYTFSRQGVIYTLLCSDCNTEWTTEADVTYGSTTYVCSRCGESKIEGDATEETQETWFTKFIYKFKWLSSIGQIYRQLVADITSDAETAAAIADGTVTLDEVTSGHAELGGGSAGSEGSGRQYTAPELAVSFGDSDHYGVDWDAIKPLNLSWYAPHKETVDGIVSGILWLGFLFLLIKRAPGIIQGAEMITEDRIKIDFYNRR